MAVPTPPEKKRKGAPPGAEDTRNNLDTPEPGAVADLNFKVPEEFKRRFKLAAVARGASMKDLMMEIVEAWLAENPL